MDIAAMYSIAKDDNKCNINEIIKEINCQRELKSLHTRANAMYNAPNRKTQIKLQTIDTSICPLCHRISLTINPNKDSQFVCTKCCNHNINNRRIKIKNIKHNINDKTQYIQPMICHKKHNDITLKLKQTQQTISNLHHVCYVIYLLYP